MDTPQLFSIGLELLIALALIAVIVWVRQISETQNQISETQRQITQTQHGISQTQREQTAILQQLITQIAVMEARQESGYPNG